MIIVIDVFSRYAIGTIVPDLKSKTVARALRDSILIHSRDRPEELVLVFEGLKGLPASRHGRL